MLCFYLASRVSVPFVGLNALPVLVSKALGFDHPESSEGAGTHSYKIASLCIQPVMR